MPPNEDERAPLLAPAASPQKPQTIRRAANEALLLAKTATPVILAYTLQNSLQTASVLIVGRLSPEALSVAAFAYMFAMVTAWLIALGGTTAIDTLASASFTGSKNPHDLGVILQRAFVVLLAFYVPVVALWCASEPLFKLLGQEPWLARDASRFLMVLAPGGLGYLYFEAMKKYLQAQGIMEPGTYVLLVTSPLNILLNWLFIYPLKLGLLGAALATGISYWLSFGLLVLYTILLHRRATHAGRQTAWGGLSRRALEPRQLWTFVRLAFAGCIHVGTEMWAFEIIALVAGRLGRIPLATQSVIMTTDLILNTIPFGLGVATSARVGNLLGATDAQGARRAAHTAAFLAMAVGAVVGAILMGVRYEYAKLFNPDPDVVALTGDVMPYVAVFQIADGLVNSQSGALRGIGSQHIGATVNIICYYAIALPIGIYLAFHGWGLGGLWLGNAGALYLVGIVEWIIICFANWEKEVQKAFGRMESDQIDSSEEPQPA